MIHVLVVDDSAVMRELFHQLLSRAGGFNVATAADPFIALDRIRNRRPDVVVLDVELPRMDGLTFLKKLMAEQPIPVVICSGLAEAESSLAVRALAFGAVDVVARPRVDLKGFVETSGSRLLEAIRAAAQAKVGARLGGPGASAAPSNPKPAPNRLVVMGASTGGTEALRTILTALPPTAPPIAIVQHMPAGFTRAFAKDLSRQCRVRVAEAQGGEVLAPGFALIAPGDRHLCVVRRGPQWVAALSDAAPIRLHRPSVDLLFESAARVAGADAFGVLLTGMGDDGARGLTALREAGGATVAQDERSCVVFGMPKEAIARGAAGRVLPLGDIAAALLEPSPARR